VPVRVLCVSLPRAQCTQRARPPPQAIRKWCERINCPCTWARGSRVGTHATDALPKMVLLEPACKPACFHHTHTHTCTRESAGLPMHVRGQVERPLVARVLDTNVLANIMTAAMYAFKASPGQDWLDTLCRLCTMVLEHVREHGGQVRAHTRLCVRVQMCMHGSPAV